MQTILSLSPRRTEAIWARERAMVRLEESERGSSDLRRAGWMRGSICERGGGKKRRVGGRGEQESGIATTGVEQLYVRRRGRGP